MGVDDIYSTSNTGLRLGLCLGLHDQSTERNQSQKKKVLKNPSKCSDNNNKAYPSLTLGPPEEEEEEEEVNNNNDQLPAAVSKSTIESCCDHHQYYYSRAQVVTSPSAESSAFSYSSSIKRETADHQVLLGGEELIELDIDQVEKVAASVDEDGNPRKKLRLTKEQSAVLEENFREHSTLNPKQKQELAKRLNLRARQVEVWFQNRRARTKLKQTESDCELLKKCCETLKEENKKLQKEVQELKSMQTVASSPVPFYMQINPAAATLTICPSCERICGGNNNSNGSSISPTTPTLLIGSQAHHHFYKNNNYPFSSAAC